MASDEHVRTAGRLIADACGAVVAVTADVHRAVTRRIAAAVPPGARAVVAAPSAIADLVYAGVASGVRRAPVAVADLVVRSGLARGARPLGTVPGPRLLAAVNGLWGDTFAVRYPPFAVPALLTVDGRPTVRIVVFVHGLGESRHSWDRTWDRDPERRRDRGQPSTYGDRLRAELGYTPVSYDYNSGLPVEANGRLLAEALDRLVATWPVPVEEVALVGHSMGGLVARAAREDGRREDRPWVPLVRTVVTLGTPHRGAPAAKAAQAIERMLAALPESAPLARLLAARSAGVHDLRIGVASRDGAPPEGDDAPPDDGAPYRHVATALTADPRHPVGWLLGDGLVRYASAVGGGRTSAAPPSPDDGAYLPGLHHFSLLNHPQVYGWLRTWLDPDRP